MEVGLVRSVDIDSEMQQAYLDYAMSVIVARALPDARDGLKPVHRRILYAMHDMGLRPDTAYKKSARIVGEVLGKYHPHGDMAVYDAMARMAQTFSMRVLLVDGQGNFGSVDGDPPAAMRYTEARMAPISEHMLADIQKNTVDFSENFDGTLTEPDVLPAAFPNLLVNGATGIAVGMSTSIPPHNLSEVVEALKYMLENWEGLDDISVEDLMQFIQGPDFPTGGILIESEAEEAIKTAYGSGRGRVTVQARAHVEEMDRGRTRIIVTELPYMTNKASLIERIAELAREERLEGLADLRDESDRQGLRIVIELNKNANPEAVLQELYKSTTMRSTFSIIMLALVEGEPRLLSLKQALRVYLEHRLAVVKRRSEYDLEKARQRAHILEGLLVALKNLDDVIQLIRKSPDAETAKTRLIKRYKLSDLQAQAILDMPLRRLAALERKKIEEEYKEVKALIKDLEALLRSPKKMRQVVSEELGNVKTAYGDRRRTQIVRYDGEKRSDAPLVVRDLTPEKMVWVSVSPEGLISRSLSDKQPQTSGSGAPIHVLRVNSRDTLYLISSKGDAAAIPVHSLPETDDLLQGKFYYLVSPLESHDELVGLFNLPHKDDRPSGSFILTGSRQGMIKKSPVEELPGPSAKTFTLVKINEGDRFGWVCLTGGDEDVLLATAQGMAIRFSEEDVRPMGLVAAGVNGIKLDEGDEVVGLETIGPKSEIAFIASNGKAKRVAAKEFPQQGRYGKGVVAWKLPRGVRMAGTATGTRTQRVTLHLEKLVPKDFKLQDAPLLSRTAQGKPVVDVKKDDRILALTTATDLPVGNTPEPAVEPVKKSPPRRSRSKDVDTDGKVSGGSKRKTESKKTAARPDEKTTKAKTSTRKSKPARTSKTVKAATTTEDAEAVKPKKSTRSKTASKTTAKQASTAKTKAAATGTATAKSRTKKSKTQASDSTTDPVKAETEKKSTGKRQAAAEKPAADKMAPKKTAAKKPAAEKSAVKKTTTKAKSDRSAAKKPASSKKSSRSGSQKAK